MGQDWERVGRELAEILSRPECVGNPEPQGLLSFDYIRSQQEPATASVKYSADGLLEHIAQALKECVGSAHGK
jgi:hypothetical protein